MHLVLGNITKPPFPENVKQIHFGMGCFWGVEKLFWNTTGVWSTAVGYAGGDTQSPTYKEVCNGNTGHAEVVKVVYDPNKISLHKLLSIFWESHDPTQGDRQGNDYGSQYRSMILTNDNRDYKVCIESSVNFQKTLNVHMHDKITTEIIPLEIFYYAEEYHQQYLQKNPYGYCSLKGLGIKYKA